MTGAPAAKKLKITRKIIHLDEFKLHSDCHYHQEINTSKSGCRFAAVYASLYDHSKVLLQLNGGGTVPSSFGIKIDNEYESGHTSLIYNIQAESEVESLRQLTTDMIQLAIANKKLWWPKGITNTQIKENLAPLFTEKKLKSSGADYWPAQMKVKIPLDVISGEVKACDIKKNPGNVDVPFTDLPGSTWETLVVELNGFYFVGKYTWGVVKQLFKLQISSKKKTDWKVACLSKNNNLTEFQTDAQIQAQYLRVVQAYNKLIV